MINTLTEKLEAHEKLIQDLQCKSALHEVNASKNNDYLSSKFDSVNANLLEKISQLEFRLNEYSSVILNLNIIEEKQNVKIENLINDAVNIINVINSISEKLKTRCSYDDLSVVQSEMRLFTKQNYECVSNLAEQINSHENKCVSSFVETSKEIHKIQTNVNQSLLEEKKLHNLIETCNEEIVTIKASNKALHEDLSDGLIKMMDDKINAIPKPVIPSLDEAKSAMKQQLEPVSLDAKNANMRSTNTDVKVHILEKKLEQLKLMVEQINLQG